MTDESHDYEYVAYVDESGDPGLSRIKPIDNNGASEWCIVSAVVVRRANEVNCAEWVDAISRQFNNYQARAIHFSKLKDSRRMLACEEVASRPLRIFVVASNKKNMRRYRNAQVELKSLDRNWFYCWLTRVLLERVTHWVENHSIAHYGAPRSLKIVFSTRGGLSYSQMKAYFAYLAVQSRGSTLVLTAGDLRWSVVRQDLTQVVPHQELPGLQLADISASAFFKACDKYDTGACDPRFAKQLKPRVAFTVDEEGYRVYAGYGVKLLPSLKGAKLLPEQAEIFRYYGYPRQWWAPTPSTPAAL